MSPLNVRRSRCFNNYNSEWLKRMSETMDSKEDGTTKAGQDFSEGSDVNSTEENSSQVEILQNELDGMNDKYLRALAEFENLKRRTEKEVRDVRAYGQESIMKDLLSVVDSFDKAFESNDLSGDTKFDSQLKGFELIRKLLGDVLDRHGLSRIQAEGTKFDPNLHQAIQKIEDSEVSVETVATVYQQGYVIHGRLLRPAMVAVKVPPA
jgi:molecular chaperone GrpE